MIHVLASLQIKDGHLAEFVAIFRANVPNVLQEHGCIEYIPVIDVQTDMPRQVLNKNVVTVVEKWASLKDLITHSKAPHMLAYGEQVKAILENVSLKILKAA